VNIDDLCQTRWQYSTHSAAKDVEGEEGWVTARTMHGVEEHQQAGVVAPPLEAEQARHDDVCHEAVPHHGPVRLGGRGTLGTVHTGEGKTKGRERKGWRRTSGRRDSHKGELKGEWRLELEER
jgi:hypothetical protein